MREVPNPEEKSVLTSRNDVVHHQDRLAWFHGILLDLEEVLAIFLLKGSLDRRPRELAPLANRRKARAQPQGQAGAEEEASGVEADHDIGLLTIGDGEDLEFERSDEGFVERGRGEQWQDVDEVDAGDGEVGKLSQGAAQAYLCTGEFGGTGGRGGGLGLEFRGIVNAFGVLGWRGGHCGGKKGTKKGRGGRKRAREKEGKVS